MSSSVVLPSRARSSAALVLAGVLWGTGGLSGSLLGQLAGLHPLAVATYRLLLGGVAGLAYVAATGRLRVPSRAALRRLLAVGGLFAFFQTSYFVAVSLSSVSIATMTTIGSSPVVLAVVSAVRSRRAPRLYTLVSLTGSLGGLVLLRWSPEAPQLAGIAFAVLAGAGFSVFTLITAKPVPGLDSMATTAYGCLVGGVLLTPVAAYVGMALPAQAGVLLVAAYFGVVPTAAAYAAYFRGLAGAHPVLGALSALLEPLTATILSVAFLHERLSAHAWAGAVLLVAALAVGYWRPEPR
ncbi:DMT family transporter [Amycolatopsis jiangsuensis]|uniref:DME family drug/metabolite transporter n=1 Tax=Amycolatopsis jiangsuensis TaxID=1181879 RepID=A0A840IUZ2_9PSEU|nr:DMT family transporter [Amycolatopsis jiangsuensis]MBB4685022.1 DME family drug/metabolite transporter [Amycolatopsis jiangsuensis]